MPKINPMYVKKMEVVCDEDGCDWIQEIDLDGVTNWYNKPCPICGKGIIINDDDIASYNSMMSGVDAVNAVIDQVDSETAVEQFNIVIDTSPLRVK